ncbi:YeeE/YedE family protein [Pseudomonas sp. NW5]|uniref:YeeE/YedE family protein n=1 Tax=Pseudomonas sp. NW5 TaxID=2934934 RepID=UPI00202020CC|nr:YeeE/YedE family protein [Pseudomonas sp. NW5]MCL7461357.1 YeeE/YedE family protein [Pseudomonas sp. NW5]
MNHLSALVAGLLFGVGLLLAGMADPAKVLAFLDLAGNWDPSLAFVMGGGIAAAIVPFTLAKRRQQSLIGCPMQLPTKREPDRALIVGSLLFGIGWGLAGICPGPGVVVLASGNLSIVPFVLAMLAGMGLYRWYESRRA